MYVHIMSHFCFCGSLNDEMKGTPAAAERQKRRAEQEAGLSTPSFHESCGARYVHIMSQFCLCGSLVDEMTGTEGNATRDFGYTPAT